jgi:hypothetical protein
MEDWPDDAMAATIEERRVTGDDGQEQVEVMVVPGN